MIKITGPMMILFLTAVFLFFAATNVQVGWVYLVDALLWSVVVMAFVLPFVQLRRLQIKRHFPAAPYAGQPLQVDIELSHTRRWPLAFVNLEDLPPQPWRGGPVEIVPEKGFVLSLSRGESYRYSYHFVPQTDGVYVFPGLRAGSFGPLGLIGLYWKQKNASAVVVRPLPPAQVMKLMSDEQQVALMHARQRSHFSEDISHFREYQPGDNKRSIHWKNTAKRQKLIVAEAREEPFQQALLLVDVCQDQDQAVFHQLARQAERVCHALLENQMELSCFAQTADQAVWQSLGLPTPERSLQNVRHWDKASYWLATLEPDAPEQLEEALSRQGISAGEQLVVLVSARPSPDLLRRLCTGRAAEGLTPMIVFSGPDVQLPADLIPLISLRPLA
ncbi:MAG: hypothetical protein CVV27_18535 [Candidatus Melainabacteria bacterium HGW-Melainabacteria-1]|nr:MAG: hypothetical protein CVV27_18535 [Candidatus Melainabacteria bacterium HGW-Melainabacteria-1]